MSNYDTHLIQHFPKLHKSILVRLPEGMIIAVREGIKVASGEDPRQQDQRAYLDEKHAAVALRQVADIDCWNRLRVTDPNIRLDQVTARVSEEDAEPRIVMHPGALN